MDKFTLLEMAKDVSQNSYSPYSKFPVGACVLTDTGNTYTGCNFENASFGLTICAERNAVGTAIANGERKIKAIAIYSPNMEICTPCGACRQVLAEFQVDGGCEVITQQGDGVKTFNLNSLLPEGFEL